MIGSQKQQLLVFGWDISTLPQHAQFTFSVAGVFFCYLLYGYLQEFLFKLDGFKPYGWYLTFVQFGCYTIFGTIEWRVILRNSTVKIPIRTYFLLAFLTVSTMGLSNYSLGFLNYPTQVIFKCCKLIPVMIGGVLIQNKKYVCLDYLACILMSFGLSWFILADSEVQAEFNFYGVVVISLALCADAVIGNVQEKNIKQYSAPNSEVVLFSYAIGFVYIFFGLVVTGNFVPGFMYYLQDPVQKYGYTMLFAFTGYAGITFVLILIRAFGALTAVTVTTCRKGVTMILSFMLFSKPFTIQYVWSGVIVLLGIGVNVYQKNRPKIDQKVIALYNDIAIKRTGGLRRRAMMQEI